MDTTHELAAILRDARKGALLRMRVGDSRNDGKCERACKRWFDVSPGHYRSQLLGHAAVRPSG